MKKITLSLLALLSAIIIIAQPPQTFKYQAVARDAGGVVLADQNVSFLINILEGSAGGTSVYAETHTALTNQFGLVNLEIGNGLIVSGIFEDINWGSNLFFLQIEMDATGGENYQLMGTSQLLSVPYALNSETTSDTLRWQKNVDDLFYMNGKVGIGTTTPLYNMEIHSTHNGVSRLRLSNLDYSKSLFFGSGSETHSPAIYFEGSDALRFMRYESGVGYSELMRIQADGNVGVGTNAPDPAALLEMDSHSKGFLPPRMTTAERISIPNPPEGLMIYNTDKKTIEFFDGNYWRMPNSPPGASPDFVCGDNFLDTRNEKMYNTVMIGDQCWMSENMNIGTLIPGSGDQTDNSDIEKYCYDDLEDNCNNFGGLYQWNEMMQYVTTEGTQGICPDGWYIPSDEEWKKLEGAVDSYYGYPDPHWNLTGWRGSDAGLNLKSTGGWTNDGNGLNLFGFTGLPNGYRDDDGSFLSTGSDSYLWSSTQNNSITSWYRRLQNDYNNSIRTHSILGRAFGVRCLHGEYTPINNLPYQPTNPSPSDGSIDIEINSTLSWTCTDPDGDPLTYDVYFGTSSPPPLLVSGQSETTHDPGALANESVYYWKIVAHDDNGNFTEGEVWSYTTIPQSFACGDVLIDSRDTKSYATVLIGSQCWMAENLNIGDQLLGANEQTDNSTIEKHCYDDLGSNCDAYGGLYQWDEMMEYSVTEGAQGICPAGWHLPTDAEWCILTQEIDPTVNCGITGQSGTDVGTKMKSTTNWNSGGNGTNESGITAFPGGYRASSGGFASLGNIAFFWSSTEDIGISSLFRGLSSSYTSVNRFSYNKASGFSVRCLQGDYTQPLNDPPELPSNPSPGDGSVDIGINSTLSWACTDPNGDPLTYDVYFGTASPPPLMVSGQSETTYDPGVLANETVYYWKITAHDDQGYSTEGPEWSFTCETAGPPFNCGDNFTDDSDGQSYSTVLIGTQCWMAENLNAGILIPGSSNPSFNSVVEKYCYNGFEYNCDTYGGLYQWGEMMNYNFYEGVQGICPDGWHIPSDSEWCIVTQEIDPTVDCELIGLSGIDVGTKMKNSSNWNSGGNGTNESGFNALAAGYRYDIGGLFVDLGNSAFFWSSSESENYGNPPWYRFLSHDYTNIYRNYQTDFYGYSVRCIKD